MKVIELTQSFQSVVESISTTKPADQFVSKDLFQNTIASFANNIFELVKSVNRLSWGFNTGIQTLSVNLENLEETAKILHTNNTEISERMTKWDSNNTKIMNNIKQLSDRVQQTDTINKQNINVLFNRLNYLEENSSKVQDGMRSISDRLHTTETYITTSHQATVEKMSEISESVKNLHERSSSLMSNFQNQQTCLETLTNNVTHLQEKSDQMIMHSTPKPPPGIPHRSISNSPFFVPKPPPDFEIAATLHHSNGRTINLSPKPDTMKSGEISPPFNSFSNTELGPEKLVSQTDKDGTADLQHRFTDPSKSITVSPSDPFKTEASPVSSQISQDCTFSGHSDNTAQSAQVISVSTVCQSFRSHNDSGILSMLDQSSSIKTLSNMNNKTICNTDKNLIPESSISEYFQNKAGEECSREKNTSSGSSLIDSTENSSKNVTPICTPCFTSPFPILPSATSIDEQNTVHVLSEPTLEICVDPVKALTDNVSYTGLNQPKII